MSKDIPPFTLSLAQCGRDLDEFRALLEGQSDLSEAKDILPFFSACPHLAALIGSLSFGLEEIDCQCAEFDLFGNFRSDWVVGSSRRHLYTLIEFEDARRGSIFHTGRKYHDQSSPRFEHGFSQMVDWFWALDAYRGNPDFTRRFGAEPRFFGMLLIGRSQFMRDHQIARLHWRLRKVLIDSHQITCFTFDELFERLNERLGFVRRIAQRGELF